MNEIDQSVLAQAIAYANAFAFGLTQLLLAKIPKEWKPGVFTLSAVVATCVLYFAMQSDAPVVKLLLAALASAYGVTGAVDFYKKDVKAKPENTPV